MSRISLLACLCLLAPLTAACGKPSIGALQGPEAQPPKPPLGKGTPAQNLTNAYLVLQAKLARDDLAGARAAIGSAHSAIQASELPVSAELRTRLEAAALAGDAAKDLAGMRVAFGALSEAVLTWFAVQGNPLNERLSIAHCPMAFDGKGGKWLQVGDSVRNPYFGNEMLTCGSVDATLTPGKTL